MPINEQKIILNLQNNLEHKPITAEDLPGVNRIGLLSDDTLHFEYDPVAVYGKRPDMIDNTVGTPTKGIRDKALNGLGLGVAGVMALPVLTEIGGGLAATEMGPVILANIGRFGWKVLNHPITQTVGTIDGFRNLLSGNGVQKTYNHFKNREWGKGALSLAGDILDASPLIGITKSVPYIYKYFKNTPVEKISSFDDVVDKSIDYWHRQIDPNVRKSDYLISEHDLTNTGSIGRYLKGSKSIEISPNESRWTQRDVTIHEMRHHDDYDLNLPDRGDYASFTLYDNDMREFGKHYGRLKLNTNEQDLLKFTYRTLPIRERVAVNADFRATLEGMMQRTSQKIPSRSELDNYIQKLPWPVLSFGRMMSGYSSKMSGAIFLSPDRVKSTLIDVK